MRIISLDIASISSGWCYAEDDCLKKFGLILVNKTNGLAERLSNLRDQFSTLLKLYVPTDIVIEDNFAGNNIKTLKSLSRFSGVAIETSFSLLNIEPYIVHNRSVKKFHEVKTKEELFDKIKIKYYSNSEIQKFKFKEHNDITDAIAQFEYYYNLITCPKEEPLIDE